MLAKRNEMNKRGLFEKLTASRTVHAKIPVLVLIACNFYLSSRSTLPAVPSFRFADKAAHFAYFFAVAAAWALWFSRESWKAHRTRNIFFCAALASACGVLDEFHQYFVPGRNCDVFDWIADTLGALPGSIAGYAAARRTRV
ncbi:MAG: VanZ family protein [Treponema sp.]|jgi:VanZ family protein|nr:VanZ family protein [Treponema sp.]